MSFADLRSKREARLKSNRVVQPASGNDTLVSLQQQSSSTVSSSVASSSSNESSGPASSLVSSNELKGLYEVLPSILELRSSPDMGRGLYLKRDDSKLVKAGTVLFQVTPHVSALSTRCLSTYCSYCQAERTSEDSLKRCGSCKSVYYDSQACQNADWIVHKNECNALKRWANSAREAGITGSKDAQVVPGDAVRALGRILWSFERLGVTSAWSREIDNMQSLRKSLTPTSNAQSNLTSLGHSIARYMGLDTSEAGFSKWGIESSTQLVDLLSKFAANSFSLTTPLLSPIGVAVSPLAALINHSCAPNVAVMFPNVKIGEPMPLTLVAIQDIEPGSQLFNSYVDITISTTKRKKELADTYMFDCRCPTCTSTKLDPRTSLVCPKCQGLTPIPDTEGLEPLTCDTKCKYCPEILMPKGTDFANSLKVTGEALEKATKLQFTDFAKCKKYTSSALSLLQPFPLHLSFDPLLAIQRLHLSLLIDGLASLSSTPPSSIAEQHAADAKVDEAARLAARCVAGLSSILPHGHPVRGIALAELGKLLCVDVDPNYSHSTGSELLGLSGPDDALPRGADRLQLAAQILYRAREELQIGFGRNSGGGQVGKSVEGMLRDLEREVDMWKKTTSAGTANSLRSISDN